METLDVKDTGIIHDDKFVQECIDKFNDPNSLDNIPDFVKSHTKEEIDELKSIIASDKFKKMINSPEFRSMLTNGEVEKSIQNMSHKNLSQRLKKEGLIGVDHSIVDKKELERQKKEAMEYTRKEYQKLNKKIYICEECNSHTLVDKNAEPTSCCRCGGKRIREVGMHFLPLTFKQIKDIDTLEISADDFAKYRDEAKNFVSSGQCETYGIFLKSGVVKNVNETITTYIVFNVINEGEHDISVYIHSHTNNSFYYCFKARVSIMTGKPEIEYAVYNDVFLQHSNQNYDINDSIKFSFEVMILTQSIFCYLASKREIEEVKTKTDPSKTITETTKSGKVRVKKKHIIYITDNIKIYTYDNTFSDKLRHHKVITMPFWKVKGFTRRVFDKADRDLPMSERRVVKISNVAPFLKGRDRLMHSLDECGLLYKIAR